MAPLSVLCIPVGCCTIAQELPELFTLNIAGLGGEKPVCAITVTRLVSMRVPVPVSPLQSSAAIVLHAAQPKAMLA
jgi:hypothetical protein